MTDHFRLPKDFESLVYLTQLLQAEAMRIGVEHWRRNRDCTSGALYWQLNDCWPVASWASIDYFGRWKALHYAARRFFAPRCSRPRSRLIRRISRIILLFPAETRSGCKFAFDKRSGGELARNGEVVFGDGGWRGH